MIAAQMGLVWTVTISEDVSVDAVVDQSSSSLWIVSFFRSSSRAHEHGGSSDCCPDGCGHAGVFQEPECLHPGADQDESHEDQGELGPTPPRNSDSTKLAQPILTKFHWVDHSASNSLQQN